MSLVKLTWVFQWLFYDYAEERLRRMGRTLTISSCVDTRVGLFFVHDQGYRFNLENTFGYTRTDWAAPP